MRDPVAPAGIGTGVGPGRWLPQVLALLIAALIADYGTGPFVNAAAFYVFPVALAGWNGGGRVGAVVAAIATGVNALTEWSHPSHPIPEVAIAASAVLRGMVLVVVGMLSAFVARQQKLILEQRDQLAGLYRRLEGEMQATRTIQDLLMLPPPSHPAYEAAVTVQPARILGGDVAALFFNADGRLAVLVADVSGKGGPAALAGAVLIGLLDHAPERSTSPAETLRYLNTRLVERLPDEMFVTLFYGLLDLTRGELTYASAGHEESFLVRASGEVEMLTSTGMVLGVLDDSGVDEAHVSLRPGDLFFAFTDGATDVRVSETDRLGMEGLRQAVLRHAQLPCEALLDELRRTVFSDPAQAADDITLLAVRYAGPEPGSGPA